MKKLISSLIFLFLPVLLFSNGFSSEASSEIVTITGTVVDVEENPIVYATVTARGTTIGTFTDSGGHYSISVHRTNILVFQMIGYKTKEYLVSEIKPINGTFDVVLEDDI
ncbi:MAG: carboxypeptidase-like regulatory domain-containing protein [Candidatus Cryptobacteroides sp.]